MPERIVRAVITGSASGAVAAFGESATAAELSGSRISKAGMTAAKDVESSGTSAWGKVGAVAGTAAVAIGVAAVTASGFAIKMAGDFQQATTAIVTGAGESVTNLELIRQGLLKLAPEVGSTPVQLAKALYNIESAGFHGAQGLTILRASAEGAKVGMADQAVVADALTTAMNAYHMPASAATAVTSQLIATVAAGKTHMQDLAGSMGTIVPIAAALHVPFQQITAAMATMTVQGTDVATSATSLRFLLNALAGPTAAAAKEMAKMGIGEKEITGITASMTEQLQGLGVHTTEVADTLTHKGLYAALGMITEAIGRKFPEGSAQYAAALKAAVGGTRGLTAALELTGQNTTTFAQNMGTIGAAAMRSGAHVQGWSLIQDDFNFKMAQARAAVSSVAIQLGNALLPAVTKVAGWFAGAMPTALTVVHNIFKTLGDVIGYVKQHFDLLGPPLLGIVGGLIAYKVITTAVTLATEAFTAVQAVFNLVMAANPVAIIVLALAALGVAIALVITHFNQIKSVVLEVWNTIGNHIGGAVNVIIAVVRAGIGFIVTWFTVEFNIIKGVVTVVFNIIYTVISVTVNLLKLPIGIMVNLFNLAFLGIRFVVEHVFVPVIQGIVGVVRGVVGVVGNVLGGITTAFRVVFGGLAAIVGAVAAPIGAAIRGIVGVAKGIIDGVITAINWVIGVIDAIQVHIHFGPVNLDWGGVGIPKLPMLETGGIITAGGLAMVHPAEVIVNPRQQAAAMGHAPVTNHVTINVLSNDGRAVVNALKAYMQQNGALPVTVQAASRLGPA